MNFTDLQVELRSIEEHISALQVEIEKMKPQTEDEKKANFQTITRLAFQYPIKNRQLLKAEKEIQKEYIRCLSYISLADESNLYEKLLFLSRIAAGIDRAFSAEEIYQAGLDYDEKNLDEVCTYFEKIRYSLLVDALILANITEGAHKEALDMIASMAELMKCDKDEIWVLAQVAKATLTNNFKLLETLPPQSDNRWSGQFSHYIPESWFVSQRIDCGKYRFVNTTVQHRCFMFPNYSGCTVIHSMEDRSLVKKGDQLVVYYKGADSGAKKTQKAPSDGVIYFINNAKTDSYSEIENICIYITSYFDEYNDFCDWYKANKK